MKTFYVRNHENDVEMIDLPDDIKFISGTNGFGDRVYRVTFSDGSGFDVHDYVERTTESVSELRGFIERNMV